MRHMRQEILTQKYVLHIPEYKHENNQTAYIKNIDEIIEKLTRKLEEKSYSYYIIDAHAQYNGRKYTEKLINIYSQEKKTIPKIFEEWFKSNNSYLKQESFAYEENGKLFIITLKEK